MRSRKVLYRSPGAIDAGTIRIDLENLNFIEG